MAVKCILTGQTPSVLDGVTENVQTQIDAKAADSAVVHKTGNEIIAGTKTFTGGVVMKGGADVASSGNAVLNVEGVATDTDYIDMYVSGGTNKTRPLVLQNNSTGSGNVGVGTATPSEKLEVVGNVKATKFKGDGSELTNVPYPVTSVAGKTGVVTLVASDVGLSNVDNTSDANKPISTATQTALDAKQNKITASGLLKGDGSGGVTAAVADKDYKAYNANEVCLVKQSAIGNDVLCSLPDSYHSLVPAATSLGTDDWLYIPSIYISGGKSVSGGNATLVTDVYIGGNEVSERTPAVEIQARFGSESKDKSTDMRMGSKMLAITVTSNEDEASLQAIKIGDGMIGTAPEDIQPTDLFQLKVLPADPTQNIMTVANTALHIPYVGQESNMDALSPAVSLNYLNDQSYVNAAQLNAAVKGTALSVTLASASWNGTAAPYTYTISNSAITATSTQELSPATDITADQLSALQAANIIDGGQAAGSITLKAFGEKPSVDIPIRIIVKG